MNLIYVSCYYVLLANCSLSSYYAITNTSVTISYHGCIVLNAIYQLFKIKLYLESIRLNFCLPDIQKVLTCSYNTTMSKLFLIFFLYLLIFFSFCIIFNFALLLIFFLYLLAKFIFSFCINMKENACYFKLFTFKSCHSLKIEHM